MKKETALFLGITLGFAFLTGLFWGSGPLPVFAATILLAIGLILFTSQRKAH